MYGLGTLANCVAIIIGALLGVFCKRGLPEKWQATMMNSIALCIFIIGVQMALKTQNIIFVILGYIKIVYFVKKWGISMNSYFYF